jgi:hypothetical protein
MDDSVDQFTSITGASASQASQYLRLTDNNLEQAIQLFFEDPSLATDSPEAQTQSAPPPVPLHSRPTYTEDASGVVHIASDDESDLIEMEDAPEEPHQPPPDTEDDEAIARRLQEEMYQGGGVDPDGVRAPISRTTETLVGPGASWGSDDADINALVAEQMARRQRLHTTGRPGIFNQRDTVWGTDANSETRAQHLSMATGGASTASSKSNMLAEMYRPPFEIISRLPWDNARQEGRETEKWLLVNVQDPSIFDCQVLNRDIWRNKDIQDAIREHFLFLQYNREDPRGASYIQYYFQGSLENTDAYPHIAIVDPRTGEQVKVWSGAPIPTPQDFLMQLYEFLDRYSLKANVRNPVAKRKAERKDFDIGKMSEEEMLQIAMENSLASGSSNGGPVQEDPDALTKSMTMDKGKGKVENEEMGEPSSTNGVLSASTFARISSNRPHTEPQNDPVTTTRIQFRYSGGRQVRRFITSDPVQRIYEWLKASPIEGKEGVEFDLMFMGKNLIDMIDQTIEEAGLKNATVMVEFLGQDEE